MIKLVNNSGWRRFIPQDRKEPYLRAMWQPLDRRNGVVYFMKFVYGSNKGTIKKGDDLFSPFSGYSGKDYSGELITGEQLGTANSSGALTISNTQLAWAPLRKGDEGWAIKITADVDEFIDAVDSNGVVRIQKVGGAIIAGSTVDYATGLINVALTGLTADTVVTADWYYDLNDPTAATPDIEPKIEAVTVVARPRRLKSIYMYDVAFDVKMNYGIDMDEVIMKATSGEISAEIDNEITNDLLKIAPTVLTWNKKPAAMPTGLSQNDIYTWKLSLIDKINEASETIYQSTQRYEAKFIIVGKDAAIVLEGLGKDHFERAPKDDSIVGPYFAGTLEGKYRVYKNPNYPTNAILVGTKGPTFLECGYIYAPFLPLFATQLLVDEDIKAKRGFSTVYAKKVINPKMYVRINITDV